jgi:hypothetical protein
LQPLGVPEALSSSTCGPYSSSGLARKMREWRVAWEVFAGQVAYFHTQSVMSCRLLGKGHQSAASS